MTSDDRLRALLREAESSVLPDLGALDSIYGTIEAARRGRAGRIRWLGSRRLAMPAFARALAVLVIALAVFRILPTGPGVEGTVSPPSPSPTQALSPQPTKPTTPLTSTPEPSFPTPLEAQLVAEQAPDTFNCGRMLPSAPGAVASISCMTSGGVVRIIYFSLYADPGALTAAYDAIMAESAVAPTTTECSDLVQSNHAWLATGGAAAGKRQGYLACFPVLFGSFTRVRYVWTMDDLNVLGDWTDADYQIGLDRFESWAAAVRP